jgi:hyperosmotically inducible periplasmic protein
MTDRMINASQIGVETQQGIVSLNGVVPSPEQKLRAELLTRDIQGVRQVVNNLQVAMLTPTPSSSALIQDDPMITTTIKEKLMADRLANLARVHVDTTEGIVYLNGTVPSTVHKVRAEQVARDVRGVIQVVNNLQVQP